jgi:hypothetical protein
MAQAGIQAQAHHRGQPTAEQVPVLQGYLYMQLVGEGMLI